MFKLKFSCQNVIFKFTCRTFTNSLPNANPLVSGLRNVPKNIEEKMQITPKLFKTQNHPLSILRNMIANFFENEKFSANRSKFSLEQINDQPIKFTIKEDFHPIVSTQANFYDLLVEKTNETTSPKNTYYWDDNHVLRTHMTAHDIELIRAGLKSFVTIGDVYRRDSIDGTHFPIFHQVDGVRVWESDRIKSKEQCSEDLKHILENLVKNIFGQVQYRWVDAYFPFTEPSWELEIFFNGDWLEVLGCGILRDGILQNAGLDPNKNMAWAFGIGLERLAMKLFDIKDIRLFWTKDERFLSQFKERKIIKFKPYSKYPACYKDITFYINDEFNENDFFEIVRTVTGELAEDVKCIDTFVNSKISKTSKCFRILYRHMDRTVTNEEINIFQIKIRELVETSLKLELR